MLPLGINVKCLMRDVVRELETFIIPLFIRLRKTVIYSLMYRVLIAHSLN